MKEIKYYHLRRNLTDEKPLDFVSLDNAYDFLMGFFTDKKAKVWHCDGIEDSTEPTPKEWVKAVMEEIGQIEFEIITGDDEHYDLWLSEKELRLADDGIAGAFAPKATPIIKLHKAGERVKIMAKDTIIIDKVEFSADKKILLDFFAETTEYTIPDGVTTIDEYAFESNESLKKIVIPASVTVIKEGAFDGCDLETVVLSEGLLEIQNSAFGACELKSIVIPDSVRIIGERAFSFCTSLEAVTLSKNLTKIGNGAFDHCSCLKSVVIPDGVTEIEKNIFADCWSLESVALNDNLKKIESGAFWNCKSLTSISIPAGVTEISIEAFGGCPCEEQILKDYVHLFTKKGKPCAEEIKRDYPHLFTGKDEEK